MAAQKKSAISSPLSEGRLQYMMSTLVLMGLLIAMAAPALAGGGRTSQPDDGLTYVESRVTYKEAVAACKSRNLVRGREHRTCYVYDCIEKESVSCSCSPAVSFFCWSNVRRIRMRTQNNTTKWCATSTPRVGTRWHSLSR